MKTKVLVALMIVAIVFVSGCASQKTDATASPKPTTDSTKHQETNLVIGETAKTSGIEITLISAQKIKSYNYIEWTDYDTSDFNKSVTAKNGKLFVLTDIDLKKSNSYGFDPKFFVITDSNNNSYSPEPLFNSGLGGVAGHLHGGKYSTKNDRGKVLFEVDENAKSLKLVYDFSPFGENITVSWSID